MRDQIEEIRSRAMAELSDSSGAEQIENVRVRVLGRAGELTGLLRGMRDVPSGERPALGQLINEVKRALEARIGELQDRLARAAMERTLGGERIDVTLPGPRVPRGRLHPITIVLERM